MAPGSVAPDSKAPDSKAKVAPVYSMTGTGLASGQTELGVAHVEVRSVNGRGLVVKQRLCSECQGLESALEARVGTALRRGTVLVTIDLTGQVAKEPMLDQGAAERAVLELRDLGSRLSLPADLSLRDVLMVPGLFTSAGNQRPRISWEPPEKLEALLDQALEHLIEHRTQEGITTVAVMTEELDRFQDLLAQAKARAPAVVEDHREKLLRRVNDFLQGQARLLEPSDVIREVALFADRTDVAEELQRLGAHVEKIRENLTNGGSIGRTLEFLLQETLREANTLGSKSQDATLAHIVVAMKSCIDKLKEQAANLE